MGGMKDVGRGGLGMLALARASKYWRANLVDIVIDSKEMLSRITTIT